MLLLIEPDDVKWGVEAFPGHAAVGPPVDDATRRALLAEAARLLALSESIEKTFETNSVVLEAVQHYVKMLTTPSKKRSN